MNENGSHYSTVGFSGQSGFAFGPMMGIVVDAGSIRGCSQISVTYEQTAPHHLPCNARSRRIDASARGQNVAVARLTWSNENDSH